MQDVLAGRYVLGAELGRGGMARVVAARDLRLDRAVAVKLISAGDLSTSDPTVRQRFVREARAAASFTHPHAVSVFDAGDDDGTLYLVMELVDGPSVATLLARAGPLGVAVSVAFVDGVLQALGAAHGAGIVHRDVKPGNVLVTAEGVAKLADFGIARRLDDLGAGLTVHGQVLGTPTYLAPEQVVGGPATPATDLYSTGVLLFEMLTGRPPFDAGSPIATVLAHRDAPVPDVRASRPEVPNAVAAAVGRAMAKDPAARFVSADEMRAALAGYGERREVGEGPPSGAVAARSLPATAVLPTAVVPSAPRRAPGPARWWWPAIGVAVAIATAVVLLAGRGDDRPAPAAASTSPAPPAPGTTASPPSAPPTAASTAPSTSGGPPTTVRPATASTVAGVIALLDADPASFGQHADELRRDLARIEDREGRQLERDVNRLRGRLADWTADATITADRAGLVETALSNKLAGRGDEP